VVPVPPIVTALGTMTGMDDLPARGALPDVLTAADGRTVVTRAQWQARREEMRRILSYYAVGLMPPAPGNVTATVVRRLQLSGGTVSYQLVHLSFGPDRSLGFDVAVFVPADRKGPFPTVIFPSFGLTPGGTPLPTMRRPPEQGKGLDALTLPLGDPSPRITPPAPGAPQTGPVAGPPSEPEQAAAAHAALFRRGYALATYHYQDAGEDTIGRNEDGSWAFRSTRFFPAYPGYDWGLLGAWAWSISRVADYLETQPFADRARLIAVGHSRLGKAVLVAGAFDDRLALVAPAGSGAGGTGAYRFNGTAYRAKEGLDDMVRKYPNWFSPHLREFSGHVYRLPFDQHWLMALAAPRAFISLEGTDDQNCLPSALKAAVDGARPAYELLHAAGRIGVAYARHPHALAQDDWTALLDFADLQLRGQRTGRRFDRYPAAPAPGSDVEAAPAGPARRLSLDVRALGAAGDGTTKDTGAFQSALDRVATAGGGEVVVPPGAYVVGSLVVKSNTTLRLDEGAVLQGSPDLDDYPPTTVRWEGRWADGRRALLSAQDAANIAVVGPGRIVGHPVVGTRRMPNRAVLIETLNCRGVLLQGFATEHLDMWSIHPVYSDDVTVRGLTIRSRGGDGIDVDSCRHVVIDACDIDTGDDAIAIKSGRGMEGHELARPTEDVRISDCRLGDSRFAALAIGSETSGGIRNVRVERVTVTHARTYAVYIKSRPGRGAYIEDIVMRDLDVSNAQGFLRFNLTNSGLQDPEPVPGEEGIPRTRNFRFERVKMRGGTIVDGASVPAERPLDGLVLAGIGGTAENGISLAHVTNAEVSGITVTGVAGPLLSASGVTGRGLEGAAPIRTAAKER
jgi:polygalacturonase